MAPALCLNASMSAQDNWLANLRAIVDLETPDGAKPRIGYQRVAYATGLKEEYIYQLYTGRKKRMGVEARDKIAETFADGRDPSWIDHPPAEAGGPSRPPQPDLVAKISPTGAPPEEPDKRFREGVKLSPAEWEHICWLRHFPKGERDRLLSETKALGEKWKQHTYEILANYRSEAAPADTKQPARHGAKEK